MKESTKSALCALTIITVFITACVALAKGSAKSTDTVNAKGNSTTTYTVPKTETKKKEEPKPVTITWSCVDATSYNKNPYDDNRCTSSTGEVRYVSDSQARSLDPSYTPGTSGAWYYNNK